MDVKASISGIVSKNKIARNTTLLVLGQVVTRALGIFYIAALARYVGPTGIGAISTANALCGLLVLIVVPGLETLMVRDIAANQKKVGAYVRNGFILRALFGVPFLLLSLLVAHLAGYPHTTILIIRAYALVYLFDTLGEVPVAVFRAYERMEYDAGSQIFRDLINVTLSLVAIYFQLSLLAIVYVSVIAQLCKLLLTVVLMRRRFVRFKLAKINSRISRSLLTSSLPFGIAVIFSVTRAQSGIFILSLFHPEDTVGLYAAAFSVITLLLLMAKAFSTAIFPSFSNAYAHSKHELQQFYHVCYKHLMLVGFPLAIGTLLIGDRVVLLIYGEKFIGSSIVIQILALYLFTLVGYSNGPLLNATGKERFFAWTQGLAVCGTLILCLLLIPGWGPAGAAIAFVLPAVVTFFVHSIASHRRVGLPMPWSLMSKTLLASILMGISIAFALRIGVTWLPVLFIVAPSTYGLAVHLLGIMRRDELRILARGAISA